LKILYIDTRINGHHFTYMSAFLKCRFADVAILVPPTDIYDQYTQKIYFSPKSEGFKAYLSWIGKIKAIIKNEKPDIVHFLYGDDLYRYFGLGLLRLHCRSVVTFHQVRHSRLRDISLKCIAGAVDSIVVHTAKIKRDFEQMGIRNVTHIEYPQFNVLEITECDNARKTLGIQTEYPVLLALGGTRTDKGLDILLDALNRVDKRFHLIVAGKEEDIKSDIIETKISGYRDYVTIFLEFLSDEKLSLCLNASDFVVLPYRKSFDGASGPLGEGVALGKTVLGANHGSLGELIRENHLGYTFESENVDDLASVLTKALSEKFTPDCVYEDYRKSLNTDNFLKSYQNLYNEIFN